MTGQKEQPRVTTIAEAYLRAVDGVFSGPTLTAFVQTVQQREPLTIEELWYVAPFLKFALLEMLLDEALQILNSPQTAATSKIAVRLKSLRTVTNTDWVYIIEPLILLDKTLREDPAQAYPQNGLPVA